jgi:hypothetical protein
MKSRKIKSYLKLLPSSELIIKPGKSRIYFRLILILYLLTSILIIHSSLYFWIKFILFAFILIQLRLDYISQAPRTELKELKYQKKQWILVFKNEETQSYEQAQILIHNMFFQLIKLSSPNINKLLILFNDQIPTIQMRLLHIKTL